MALIQCVKCGESYSNTLSSCPHCQFHPTIFLCPECGALHSKNESECCECGFIFSNAISEPADMETIEKVYQKYVDTSSISQENISQLEKKSYYLTVLGEYKDAKGLLEKVNETLSNLREKAERECEYKEVIELLESDCNLEDMKKALRRLEALDLSDDSREAFEKYKASYRIRALGEAEKEMSCASTIESWNKASLLLEDIDKDEEVERIISVCKANIEKLQNAKKKKRKSIILSGMCVVAAVIVGIFVYNYTNPKEARELKKQIALINESVTKESKEELDSLSSVYASMDEHTQKAVKNYDDLLEAYDKYYGICAEEYDTIVSTTCETIDSKLLDDLKKLEKEYQDLDQNIKAKTTSYETLQKSINACYKICAEEFDENITKELENVTADSVQVFKNLEKKYQQFDDGIKKLVTKYKDIETGLERAEEAKANSLANIMRMKKVEEVDEIESLINTNKELLTKYDKLDECLVEYGRRRGFFNFESLLKDRLKNPSSYHRYSGSCKEAVKGEDGSYTSIVTIDYSGTNSFGGTVRNTATGIVSFTLRGDNLPQAFSIRFTS